MSQSTSNTKLSHGQGRERCSKHPDKELCREPPDSYVEGTSLRNAPFWLWGLPLSSFLLAFRNYSAAEARLIQFQGDGGRSRVTGLSYSTWPTLSHRDIFPERLVEDASVSVAKFGVL